jgi:hypothetical protein
MCQLNPRNSIRLIFHFLSRIMLKCSTSHQFEWTLNSLRHENDFSVVQLDTGTFTKILNAVVSI